MLDVGTMAQQTSDVMMADNSRGDAMPRRRLPSFRENVTETNCSAQIFYKTPQSYIIASRPEQAQGSPVIGAEMCVDHCNIATQTLCCVPDICSSARDGGGWILTEGRKLVRFQAAVSPTLKISELFISILIDVKPIKTYSACVLPVGCSQKYLRKTTYARCWHREE